MSDTVQPDQGMLDRIGGWGRAAQRGRAWRDWLLVGKRTDPTPGCVDLYEPPGDHVGISCSGGGIRSAAFNLGALQVLQKERVLQKAKYLSAVSGGSYIAAAFCMVANRWSGKEPNGRDSDPALVNHEALPFEPGSPEEQYLRNHLGYLAPDGTAKLYLALRMLAGMSVNVLLIGLPALILGLLVGQWVIADYGNALAGRLEVPAGVWLPVVGLAALALALAVLDVIWRPRKDDLQTMTQTWQVRFFLLAAAGALLLIAVPWLAVRAIAIDNLSVSDAALGSAGTALSSMAALAAAAITHVRGHVKDQQQAVDGGARPPRQVREALPHRRRRGRRHARRPAPAGGDLRARRADLGVRRDRGCLVADRREPPAGHHVGRRRPHHGLPAPVLPPPPRHRVRAASHLA